MLSTFARRKEKSMRITPAALAISLLISGLLTGSMAQAAARAVLLPVLVGGGGAPADNLMAALAQGLKDNPGWTVFEGTNLKGLMAPPSGLKEEDRTRLKARLDQIAEKLGKSGAKEAVADLEAVRTELNSSAKDVTFTAADHDLGYRAAGLLVAALVAAGDRDKAKAVATETAAQYPGRKPREGDKLSAGAGDLLATAVPSGGVKLTLRTRPDGCEVVVNGGSAGRAPVELLAPPGVTYQAHAVCSAAAGAPELKSYPKRMVLGEKETARTELLDAEFERTFEADGGQRLRFNNSADRRQLEDTFARRVAERYGADAVVLASVGELSGADWLNGRLYLSSGYLNRQALVRLEPSRATALGRYLATGKDAPGVLKPEEAGALVAASQASAVQAKQTNPWYTDIVGWSFTGVGAVGITLGLLSNAEGRRTGAHADSLRPCGPENPNTMECGSERQMALWRDAEKSKFLGGIGLIGGGLMAVTGIVLLAIPEYTSNQGELFVFTPRQGGGTLSLSGRF
jgi:hypothetical protein